MNRRRPYWPPGAPAVLLVAVLLPSGLEAQNGSTSDEAPPSVETPLPLRIPQEAPPSPEVPLPDASGHLRQSRIEWTGEIDPDLSWIGSPWDYLPPIDEENATAPADDEAATPAPAASAVPSARPPSAADNEAARPAPAPSGASLVPGPAPSATDRPAPQSPARAAPQPAARPEEASLANAASPRLPATPAALGEVTAVSLPGAGWIYVGAIPRDADIDLVESQSGAGETLFRFRPREPGEILLSFQRQDMVTASFEESTLLLSVLEEGAPETAGDPATSPRDGEAPEPEAVPREPPPSERLPLEVTVDGDGDYEEARGLLALGLPLEALESFLSHYDGSGSPELNQEIASLAADLGYDEIAYHFWEQNLSLPSEAGSAARVGLTEHRVTTAPLPELEAFLVLLEEQNDIPDASRLLAWARSYDADGDTPNIRRALLLYETVTDWYPASPEALEAQERLRFLRRHFIEIR